MNSTKPQRANTLLGLSLDGSRLEGALLRRTNGSAEVQKTFAVTLSLDPLANEAELVGQEIRNHLDAAGIRERRCIVGVPLNWVLTQQIKLPELPEEDIASLLQLEAERGFPHSPDALMICTSRFRTPDGETFATQVAVPREHVTRLEQCLRAAKLIPVSFSIGIAAQQIPVPENAAGVLTLTVGDSGVGMIVASGGGVASLRALQGAFDSEGGEKRLQTALVARETRITLGQLPAAIRTGLHRLRIFGSGESAQQLADEMKARVEPMGLRIERVTTAEGADLGVKIPAEAGVSPALCLAARELARRATGFEFLPPKISAWQQLTSKYSSKKLVYAGVALGALVFVLAILFGWQQWQLSQLRSEWKEMSPKVAEIEDMQQQIKRFRPWFDESLRNLSIMRRLTEAFPEDGSVTAKSVEIREKSTIICSGTTRDNAALLKTLDRLRAMREIGDVKVDQIRGKSPMQFTFNFHWNEGGQQ